MRTHLKKMEEHRTEFETMFNLISTRMRTSHHDRDYGVLAKQLRQTARIADKIHEAQKYENVER